MTTQLSQTMKRLFFCIFLLCSIAAQAQEPGKSIQSTQEVQSTQDVQSEQPATTAAHYEYAAPIGETDPYFAERDSLHLPWLNHNGKVMSPGYFGRYFGGWHSWDLHKGLKASVFAEFGRHARHGAGFGQHLSAMYAVPLTDRLSVAVGGYMNHLYWQHNAMHDAGLSAVLGYKFDEHWEAYLYGQKSIVANGFTPYSFYGMAETGDRIGAAVKYNFNPSFSIQVSVERGHWPHRDSFHETYMNMLPPGY